MEAWKEELYHYGIKGMKWRKRKSSYERLQESGRNLELNTRRASATAQNMQQILDDHNSGKRKISKEDANRISRNGLKQGINTLRSAGRHVRATRRYRRAQKFKRSYESGRAKGQAFVNKYFKKR